MVQQTHESHMVLDNAMAKLGRRSIDRLELRTTLIALLLACLCVSGCATMRSLLGAGAALGQDVLDGGGTGSTTLDIVLEILVPILTAAGGGYVAARRQRKKRIDPAMDQLRELSKMLGDILSNTGDTANGDAPDATPNSEAANVTAVQDQLAAVASKLGQAL